VIVLIISLWGIISPETFGDIANKIFNFLTTQFGWFYLISMFFFVAFMLIIAFSKYGSIKLGPDDSKPEYSFITWFAMLFCAGMGIGLVFWGVAEPLNHFMNPMGVEAATSEAANFAIFSSFLRWGIHPWANYA